MLSAHYRSPLNFSAELMEADKNSLERILTAADNLKFLISNTSEEKMTESEKRLFEKSSEYVEAFERAMDDDFNTADAIAAIFDLVKYMNTTADGASSKEYLQNLLDRLCLLTDVLGIIVIKEEEMLDSEIEEMIEKRQAARKDRNFALADQIRDELLAKGIILEDTREGVKWKKSLGYGFEYYMDLIPGMKQADPKASSSIVLAYIGDCVFDLIIKMRVVGRGGRQVHKLHEETSRYVQASAQSFMMRAIQEHLTEEEHAVYRRGRNTRSVSVAKNQSITDYRRATGFEALVGYLYLKKEYKRLVELVTIGLESMEKELENGEKND